MKTVKISDAGDIMHVCVYSWATRWDSKAAKAVKRRNSEEARRRINQRNSEQKLAEMVALNFGQDDYHVVFTLSDAYNTGDYRILKRYWQQFMGRLRHARKARGADPLTYLYVMEGCHGDKRLHIHCLLKACELDGDGWAEIRRNWFYGDVMETPIKSWEHRAHIGGYLAKEPRKLGRKRVGQRIYDSSRNCKRPRRMSYSVRDDTEFVVPKGYHVLASEPKTNPFGAFEFYILVKDGARVEPEVWLK